MEKHLDFLQSYWNHTEFRGNQEAIIENVLAKNDTFALLPTGGGKSVCFQIPALMMPGICLVISPLVALMKDQVENLKNKNIKAIALTGGISFEETNNLLDNCFFGNYKFLYISPERLQQTWVLERILNLKINLVAIDEAHCISQWGHDFRPAYLKISELKNYFKVPFIALTASATPQVQNDIISLLKLKNVRTFKNLFQRKNLGYHILRTNDFYGKLQQVFTKNPEPAIVYVNTRKKCVEVSQLLNNMGFSATYYHGGLSTKEKIKQIELWTEEKTKIIVATNAFGMGIDKSNVKLVVHLFMPNCIENYYQEAGRAGRDGNKAFSLLLIPKNINPNLISEFENTLADLNFLKTIYKNLNNYLQIAYGEGFEQEFYLNLNTFCLKFKTNVQKTFNALQFLNNQDVITIINQNNYKASLRFLIPSKEVIRYCSLNRTDSIVIEYILRNYTGIFEQKIEINTQIIASKCNTSEEKINSILEKLAQNNVIELKLQNNDLAILYNKPREDEYTINRISKSLQIQNELKVNQYKSMLTFVTDNSVCKSKFIANYFGEKIIDDCDICSVCLQKNTTKALSKDSLLEILKVSPKTIIEIQTITKFKEEEIITTIQYLLENDLIFLNKIFKYELK